MQSEPPNFPDQETLEKELSDYLSKKYGYRIKVISPMMAAEHTSDPSESEKKPGGVDNIRFDMKPEELESYLNQYVIRQDEPKAILATKICTHYNRIRYLQGLARFGSEPMV
ncbi:MAG: ATPase, partial [Syntrophobacteraceae bacterium]